MADIGTMQEQLQALEAQLGSSVSMVAAFDGDPLKETMASLRADMGKYSGLKASMDIPARLVAPFRQGQQVGMLHVTLEGKPVLDAPLVTLQDAPQGGFFKRLWDAILLWFHGGGTGNTTTVVPTGSVSVAPPTPIQPNAQ